MATQRVVVEGSSVTAPQLQDLFRQIGDGSIGGHHLQAFLEHREPWSNGSQSRSSGILRFVGDHVVGPLTEMFDPQRFFENRPGLHVWESFRSTVLPSAKPSEPTGEVSLRGFDLVRPAVDRRIKKDLPEQHEVELWQIAKLIEGQKNGEDGALLTNGYANIFFVCGLAVRASWGAVGRRWGVVDWALDGLQWDAGNRVFSRN